tara:strand:- start:71638 stop:72723 length:1086 start_codon:yes stop_codon:yes gene_type:complete
MFFIFTKMKKTKYRVIGVMSGTSLDGIDLALCAFHASEKGEWDFTIEVAETIPYSEDWKEILKEAIHFSEGRLQALNEKYTSYLSEVISTFIKGHNITNLDAVCSHGHTILHEPHKGITLQIGNLPQLAKNIKQAVVCDFRVQDVQLGGQGAPLVPIGDRLLFSAYDYCLNLGGFANVSFEENEKRIAYDICPVNIVMNFYAEKLGAPFDKNGTFAEKGTLNMALLNHLNSLSFYTEKPPKSLGLEWVQQHIFPLLDASKETPQNILRTFVEHVAMQLAHQFKENSSVFITGGGAYNTFLLERLKAQKSLKIIVPNSEILEFKEALVFGLLGVLKLRNEVNCLASVTGAKDDHSSGILFNP